MYSLSLANVKLQLTVFLETYIQLCGKCSLKIDRRVFFFRKTLSRSVGVIVRKSLTRAKESNLKFKVEKYMAEKETFVSIRLFGQLQTHSISYAILSHLFVTVPQVPEMLKRSIPTLKHFRAIMHFSVVMFYEDQFIKR